MTAPMKAFLTTLKWIGTVTGIMGAILMASNLPESKYAFLLYFTSSVLWTISGVLMKDKPLLVMNLVFVTINIFGIYSWLFR